MERGSTLFLKISVFGMGAVGLAFYLLAIPAMVRAEGSSGHDPFILGVYATSIPFFIALYHAFRLLVNVDANNAFSSSSALALRNIRYCALALSALFLAGLPYVYLVGDESDAPGIIVLWLLAIGATLVIATFMAVLQKLIQQAADLKSENELTV